MSSTNNGEYIGNCKFCKDHLSLDFISCFKTSIENPFYFCSLGHYWTVKDISEQTQTQTTENSESNNHNVNESYQDKPFSRDRDKPFSRDRPFNRDKPFSRDRSFNRDRDKPEGFYKKFTSNKKRKR